MKQIVSALILSAAFLALAWGLRYAASIDMLSDETAKRAVMVLIGLGLAAYSNFTPKQIGRPGSPRAEALKQGLLRVSGWSMVLGGLAYAAIWAFAPIGIANPVAMAAVATALVVTLGYAIRTMAACRTIAAL